MIFIKLLELVNPVLFQSTEIKQSFRDFLGPEKKINYIFRF